MVLIKRVDVYLSFVLVMCRVLKSMESLCWVSIILFHFISVLTLDTEILVQHTPQFMVQRKLR